MPGGLVALLDDIAVIARGAAASIDDVSVAASQAGAKAAGVVIDDAAVTPGYVTGLTPARELPIIWKITKGSLRNKLIILLPGALLLSQFWPSAITYILLLGGAFLCYEGAEKVFAKHGGDDHPAEAEIVDEDPAKMEAQRISGAVRTDLILSAEIMAISLSEISAITEDFWIRAGALAAVAIGITFLVYGSVALIVKMDDVGLAMAKRDSTLSQKIGRFLVAAVPKLLTALSYIGTIAMLWVGGHIILDNLAKLGLSGPYDLVHHAEEAVVHATGALGGIAGWLTATTFSAIFGLILGAIIAFILHKVFKIGAH